MRYHIKNGLVIDPANKIEKVQDIVISGGKIEDIGQALNCKADETIDAKGLIVAPGLIDMHAHLREPGREDEETVATGTRAALRGGYTSIVSMPNTEPAMDDADKVEALKAIIKKDARCTVHIAGAITDGRHGKRLTDFAKLKDAAVVALSDDGACVESEDLMDKALQEAKRCSLLVIEHCEDTALAAGGVINKGFISTKMGLRGMAREAEFEMVKRDIGLAKKNGSRIHIAHVSCAESVEVIRKAKKEGVAVTAEVAPHHFSLSEDCCVTYDTNTKMNPPLRSSADIEALKEALADGTIDLIATDHAPHTDSEKDVEFDFAPFGIIGLETALSLAVVELVSSKVLSWPELISKMSANPARILGISGGCLTKGSPADIVIIDPAKEYIYSRDSIESRSKNSPFIDWKLKAKTVHLFLGGEMVMKDGLLAPRDS